MIKTTFTLLILSMGLYSYGQDSTSFPYWIEMMQDQSVNFNDVQKAYRLYSEGKDETEISGWKMYRRWEHYMSDRVDENGNRPKPSHLLNEYNRYFNSKDKSGVLNAENHWVEKGPFSVPINSGGLGRINGMAFHPWNASIIYAAASSGGLWKYAPQSGASPWTCLTDTLPAWGASCIVVDRFNPSILYMGTGDRDNSASPGLGVWKSIDEGKTWFASNNGMGNLEVGAMVMNRTDSLSLLAGTAKGIFRTTDGGNTWLRTSPNTGYYKDLVYHPTDTSIVYATESGKFYRSDDGGWTWSRVSSGLPNAYRIVIGVTEADPNLVYLLCTNSGTFMGFYKSTNAGVSFSMQSNSPNIMGSSSSGSSTDGHSWYNCCITVDPINSNVLYVGGINVWKSVNGGVSWNISTHGGSSAFTIHVDQHYLGFSPFNKLFVGNDGGVYTSNNGGNTYSDYSNGLSIGQIYKIGQSAISKELLINGYQDNGTSFYNGNQWRKTLGGDGMECIIDPNDTNIMFMTTQNGYLRRSLNHGNSAQAIYNSITEVPGAWVTPFVLKEDDSKVMYAGYDNVWRSTDVQRSSVVFTKISTNLGGFNNNGIRVLENSPANTDILYISIAGNLFYRSDNINSSSPTYTLIPIPNNVWPRDVEAHPTDENKLWAVAYGKVYTSGNKGSTWTDVSGSLPNVTINTIVYDTSSQGSLYIGTDLGVFFKGSWMNDWVAYSGGLPFAAAINELEIYYDEDEDESRIKAGTYGRGMWSSVLYTELEADFDAEELQLCPTQPNSYVNLSKGYYTNMQWEFPGGAPSSSNNENPSNLYLDTGSFDVKLKIWNEYEADSVTKKAFIRVDTAIMLSISPDTAVMSPGETVQLRVTDGKTYSWTPSASLDNSTSNIVNASPIVTTLYTVSGSNPHCFPSADQRDVLVVIQVGIESSNFLEGQIIVYPNPANGYVYIEFFEAEQSDYELVISDVSGKIHVQKMIQVRAVNQTEMIPVNNLASGIYVLSMTNGTKKASFKLLVEH